MPNPRMHGGVKTSPGTLEIMGKHNKWHSSNKPVKQKEEAIVPRIPKKEEAKKSSKNSKADHNVEVLELRHRRR